jgi:hypothetical protein
MTDAWPFALALAAIGASLAVRAALAWRERRR